MSLGQIGRPAPINQASGGAPRISDGMTENDYLRLTRRTQALGALTGLASGSLITLAVSRVVRPRPARNTLFLTFLSSSFFCSMLTSHAVLTAWIRHARAQLGDRQAAHADPDLQSWRDSQQQTRHDEEGGVAGLEMLPDRYSTTRGDH